jgi:hypothetical protein
MPARQGSLTMEFWTFHIDVRSIIAVPPTSIKAEFGTAPKIGLFRSFSIPFTISVLHGSLTATS